jgi:hypothetical protein
MFQAERTAEGNLHTPLHSSYIALTFFYLKYFSIWNTFNEIQGRKESKECNIYTVD